jgi:hypothetical protein
MPGSYPPPPPTLSSELLSIHRLLQSPTQILRRLRTLAELRFVSDQILTQRFRSSGGAVLYEVSEAILNTRIPKAVSAGAEYPRDTPGTGTSATAAVKKWGQAVFLSDEEIKRSIYAGDAVDRALRKLLNSVISKVDAVALAAVASAVTQTQAAGATWANASATIYRDIELAAADIRALNQGYQPDTLLISDEKYALMLSDPVIASLRRRETSENPIYGGEIDRIGKFKVVPAPVGSLPTDDAWVLDSRQLGGMADETTVDPGYTVAEMGVQVQTRRVPERDGWDLQARRLTVPLVQEPNAGIRITGTS